jgi:hypothetical protein
LPRRRETSSDAIRCVYAPERERERERERDRGGGETIDVIASGNASE